jgi:16S rRNA (cytidine1402-2'-O)-methyltransferase
VPLWLVATPIGTLGDLSPRAREILGSAAVIAAEDTRHTRQLLTATGIPAPHLEAVHAHNEDARADALVARAATEDVVLVSDAGTPAISDPGAAVVAAAHRAGIRILTVPGPSSLTSALAASGFPAAPSTFLGFPPRKGRGEWARDALRRPETLVVLEAGNRASDLVSELATLAPEREACLCRELSKLHEENLRRPLAALAADLAARASVRGEVVLVVGPGPALADAPAAALAEDAGLKDIAAALASRWQAPRRDVYQELLAWEARRGNGG